MMQPQPQPRPTRLFALILLALLAGCAAYPPLPAPPSTERAQGVAARGDHAQAAALYESTAANQSLPEQASTQLAAVREWLAANRPADAARVLGAMSSALTPQQASERRLLDAEVTLLSGRAQEAWQKISVLPEPAAATALAFYDLKGRIAFASGRAVEGVRAEMQAERFANPAERSQLRSQLLAQLRDARARGVRLDPQASPDPVVRGWIELGALSTETRGASLTGAAEAARWRARYPNHPATELLSQAVPQQLPATAAARVALLLPLSGANGGAGATVRDGFLSAYYQLPAGSRPDLRIYDTAGSSAASAISQARADGCEFIVGPLTREEVVAVANLGAQSIPVLALNFLPGDHAAPAGLYQFALSPEEEARSIARRILADGHHRGIALLPRGDWGNRVLAAFVRELNAGGGTLLAQASYDTAIPDYGPDIKSALGIEQSEERHQHLESVLGTKLTFEERRRADIEFIFAPALSSTTAKLLQPTLRFLYAGDIPTYSTSGAYEPDTAGGSTSSNEDLNGLMYPDMPWMVADDAGLADIRHSVETAWGNRIAWRTRYFAFGYDSCQLLVALQGTRRDPNGIQVAGLTGQLSIDADRRVQRQLIWAQIRNGAPAQLEATSAQ